MIYLTAFAFLFVAAVSIYLGTRPNTVPKNTAPSGQCGAVQYSDMMICKSCGTAWDTNDPHAPPCLGDGT